MRNNFVKIFITVFFAIVLNVFANELLILQIGAATDGNISHSFVELYNNSDKNIDLSGYSLQYAEGTRETVAANRPNSNTQDGAWQKIDLSGTILPEHSFLILGNKGTENNPALSIIDGSGDINKYFSLSNRAVKVALMSNTNFLTVTNPFDIDGNGTKTAGLIDMVGAMNTVGEDRINAFETRAITNLNKQTGQRRTSLKDTDDNKNDFARATYVDASATEHEILCPKNLAYGGWNPITGVKAGDPDPIIAGNKDWLAGNLLILQAYGSSSSAGGATHSFIELYNNTYSEINLDGITLYYAKGGSGWGEKDEAWKPISLKDKKIPAKSSFLILSDKQNSTGRLEITENSGDINDKNFTLNDRAFKVVLIRNQNRDLIEQNPFNINGSGAKAAGYIDMVGAVNNPFFDIISGFENTYTWCSDLQSARRKNLIDTDNNNTDFQSVFLNNITSEELELKRPKNVVYGSWNPITGVSVNPKSEMLASGLPVIEIYTVADSAIDSSGQIWTGIASFTLTDPNNSDNNIFRTGLAKPDRIRGRGNATSRYIKKPYRIRFREDISLFGLPARENWVLLAEYGDPTFLMNATVFELGRNVFDYQPFSCTYRHVEVYLNGEYRGVYGFTEHRQADPLEVGEHGRVKVDLKEGWLTEFVANVYFTDPKETNPKFKSKNYGLKTLIKSPDFGSTDDVANSAYKFVMDDWNELCDSLVSDNFPENGYRQLIDMNTFIDYLMAQEIVKNWEIRTPNSAFAYKENKNGKISMGPLWDFDGFNEGDTTGRTTMHIFFNRLFEDPVFALAYKERWNEKYAKFINIENFIDTMGAKLSDAVSKNTKRWKIPGGYDNNYSEDYAGQITKMKNWWIKRVKWLNTDINKVEVFPKNVDFGCGYEKMTEKIVTLVSYKEMSSLSAVFGDNVFEASRGDASIVTESTGNGSFFMKLHIKPKDLLTGKIYSDILYVSINNQGKRFYFDVPLNFVANHDFGYWQTTTASTCAKNGIGYRRCLNCGFTETRSLGKSYCYNENCNICRKGQITALNANIKKLQTDSTALNGTNVMLQTIISDLEDDIFDLRKQLDALLEYLSSLGGHLWGSWAVKIAATCSEDGIEERICSRNAEHKEIRTVPFVSNAHNYGEWNDWEITDSATCEVKGSQERIRICQNNSEHIDIETEDIPQLTGEECEVSILPEDVELQYGIIVVKNPANENAEFIVKTPEVSQIALSIYDNLGNVVFRRGGIFSALTWDLRNNNGRIVANGTYLVVVEAVSQNGTRYRYSAKLGVKK